MSEDYYEIDKPSLVKILNYKECFGIASCLMDKPKQDAFVLKVGYWGSKIELYASSVKKNLGSMTFKIREEATPYVDYIPGFWLTMKGFSEPVFEPLLEEKWTIFLKN
jgi:hypothetical protein